MIITLSNEEIKNALLEVLSEKFPHGVFNEAYENCRFSIPDKFEFQAYLYFDEDDTESSFDTNIITEKNVSDAMF